MQYWVCQINLRYINKIIIYIYRERGIFWYEICLHFPSTFLYSHFLKRTGYFYLMSPPFALYTNLKTDTWDFSDLVILVETRGARSYGVSYVRRYFPFVSFHQSKSTVHLMTSSVCKTDPKGYATHIHVSVHIPTCFTRVPVKVP